MPFDDDDVDDDDDDTGVYNLSGQDLAWLSGVSLSWL